MDIEQKKRIASVVARVAARAGSRSFSGVRLALGAMRLQSESEGVWRTIGAKTSTRTPTGRMRKKPTKKGGVRVQIKDGRIVKGPKGMVGNNPSKPREAVKEEPPKVEKKVDNGESQMPREKKTESRKREESFASERVEHLRKIDRELKRESQWQGLMGGRHEEVGKELTKEEAKDHLERLDSAPGDNPNARKVLEGIANESKEEPKSKPKKPKEPRKSNAGETQAKRGRTNEQLVTDAAKGDKGAMNELVTKNQGLVRNIASRYADQSADMDDLVQEGSIALMDAAQDFDPSKGAKFSTYATFKIRGRLQGATRKRNRGESQMPEEGGPEAETAGGQQDVERGEQSRNLRRALEKLDPRSRSILSDAFGLEGGGEMSGQEIAEKHGISRQRVSKIIQTAAKDLREKHGLRLALLMARAEGETDWITIKGTHVQIDDKGDIAKGPKGLKDWRDTTKIRQKDDKSDTE